LTGSGIDVDDIRSRLSFCDCFSSAVPEDEKVAFLSGIENEADRLRKLDGGFLEGSNATYGISLGSIDEALRTSETEGGETPGGVEMLFGFGGTCKDPLLILEAWRRGEPKELLLMARSSSSSSWFSSRECWES